MSDNYQVLLYYKYFSCPKPQNIAEWQRNLAKKFNLKGRVLVSKLGLNGTLEGTVENTKQFIKEIKLRPEFTDLWIKTSPGNGHAFPKLSVKVRKEIVTGNFVDVNPLKETARYISADMLHNWFLEKKDFYVIDMRNDYEYISGHFENSVLLKNFTHFRDLNSLLPQIDNLKDKTVVTVCTGGIRCETASALLLKHNFKKVYQLHGGIHTYMQKYPDGFFKGKLYVFDGRLVIGFEPGFENKLNPNNFVGRCDLCSMPSENYVDCELPTCHRHFICCENCLYKKETSGGSKMVAYCNQNCQLKDKFSIQKQAVKN